MCGCMLLEVGISNNLFWRHHTVEQDHAWNAHIFLDPSEQLTNGLRLAEIDMVLCISLTVGAILQTASCSRGTVSFSTELCSSLSSNAGPCSEDENDRWFDIFTWIF